MAAEPVAILLEVLLGDLYGRAIGRLSGTWQRRVARRVVDAVALPYAESGVKALIGSEDFWAQVARWKVTTDGGAIGGGGELAARVRRAIDPYGTLGPSADGKVRVALGALWSGLWQEMPAEVRPGVAGLQATVGMAVQLDALYLAVERLESEAASGEDIGWLVAWLDGLDLDDRLPTRHAGRADIEVYLRRLIDWLGEDRWPRPLGDRVLAPPVIERVLRVRADSDRTEPVGADETVDRCHRLVILGGPGAGKTWLARRTARRAAQAALEALSSGNDLASVEMPLYMTCRDLFRADGDINEAVTRAATDYLGDLGPSRQVEAIRRFLADRVAPMLVVVDSLDEAGGVAHQERLRQLDSVGWRVVLTSRPGAWTGQIVVDDKDPTHLVGRLEPLTYPQDVHGLIGRWFQDDPRSAQGLIAQIDSRADLQRSATVPLLLAFYCLLGDGEPLPTSRRDLYDKLISRLLSGSWRGSSGGPDVALDLDKLRSRLRMWAWQAAESSDDGSGRGAWTDEVTTAQTDLSSGEREALDHLATVLGARDQDTWRVRRRFIHRTILEHLVAAHLADPAHFTTSEASEALLPHLWYDADWEHAAPAAVAARPDRDQLLRRLLSSAARSVDPPVDLAVVDAGGEIYRFLARLATESNERDWAPDTRALIDRARVLVADAGAFELISASAHWTTTNAAARAALMKHLARFTQQWVPNALLEALGRLATTSDAETTTRDALLKHVLRHPDPGVVKNTINGVVQVATTPDVKATTREALLLLTTTRRGRWSAYYLLQALAPLATTPDDKAATRRSILDHLPAVGSDTGLAATLIDVLRQLDPTVDDVHAALDIALDLLTTTSDGGDAAYLSKQLVQLDPKVDDASVVRGVILDRLATTDNGRVASMLEDVLVQLAATPDDVVTTRDALLNLLRTTSDGAVAGALMDGILQLDPSVDHKSAARDAALTHLAITDNDWVAGRLVRGLVRATTADDMTSTRDGLLHLVTLDTTDGRVAAALVKGVMQLEPTPEDIVRMTDAVIVHLTTATRTDGDWLASTLVHELTLMNMSIDDQRRVRDALLDLLTSATHSGVQQALVRGAARLSRSMGDEGTAHDVFVALLADTAGRWWARPLLEGLVHMTATPDDRATLRDALLDQLRASNGWIVPVLLDGLVELDPSFEDEAAARGMALHHLATAADSEMVIRLVAGLVQLQPSTDDLVAARGIVLDHLATTSSERVARELVEILAELDPTLDDLRASTTWTTRPTSQLLRRIRANSTPARWLHGLPDLAWLSAHDIS